MRSAYSQAITSLAVMALFGCTSPQKLQQRDAMHPSILTRNVQVVVPDSYAVTPEVVRYDRYLLIDTSPNAAQIAPLEQIIDVRIPASFTPNIDDAMRYVLRQSGYSLCRIDDSNSVLYNQILPAVHYHLGPMRLSQALQIMAGPAWQLEVDAVQRVVCHSLRGGFQLPKPVNKKAESELLPPPVKTDAGVAT